ncbi:MULTISPECIES: prepilin-type N-terminal cleavage/methylation domain-containing protein [unclassified Acinetobacter]|uniref:PilW family protein n=1 Tax=unclassified Acinetobacter TaxID=196816 RepID=UPI0018A96C53|nr:MULTISPECIES: prepilin-type N-terminal cleavage/methylation domain-containing protein [unclassified Acinetobacter]MBJ9953955.1 PilW family protein [Acinetobacter baumannii]
MSFLKKNQMMNSQKGFTLIELIVALAIGLIISAAALQLFTGGLITTKMQEASAELQDSGVFGVDYVARDIRLANFGNVNNPVLDTTTPNGGIIFTSNDPASGKANLQLKDVSAGLLTKSGGSSETSASSDQLTIMFQAPNKMMNCEGKQVQANEYVIQRYFLRTDNNNLALACDANTPGSMIPSIAGLNDSNNGEVIMPRVDLVRFYIGAKVGNNFSYYTIEQFKTAVNSASSPNIPRVVSIRMMVLVRSKDPITNKNIDPSKESFNFPDGVVTLTDKSTKYLRRLYTTNIALRNGLGEKIYETSN